MLKKIQFGTRITLGLIYFIFGGMGLAIAFGLIKMPENQVMGEAAMGFMKGIMGTGYFFPFLKITEVACGLLLLTNFAAPVALVILAPVTIHIFLFHVCLTPGISNLLLPVFMVILHVVAMRGYFNVYKPLFKKNNNI